MMKMVRYKPHSLIDELQREFFHNLAPWGQESDKSLVETSDWVPRVDIKEDAQKFVVFVDVPGVNPNDIEISMEKHVLTVKGKREAINEESSENFSRVERSYGSFYRQFTLPESTVGDQITAKSKHGVLEIEIPKQEKAKSRTITVNIEE
jgi:HSP20 family protein